MDSSLALTTTGDRGDLEGGIGGIGSLIAPLLNNSATPTVSVGNTLDRLDAACCSCSRHAVQLSRFDALPPRRDHVTEQRALE